MRGQLTAFVLSLLYLKAVTHRLKQSSEGPFFYSFKKYWASWLQVLPSTLLSQWPVSFLLLMFLLLKPVQFPFSWLLSPPLVFCGRLRRIFLVAPSDGNRMGRKPVYERQCDSWAFLGQDCLANMPSCCVLLHEELYLPTSTWILLLKT